MALSLVRNTKAFISTVPFATEVVTPFADLMGTTLGAMSDLNTWQIPVLDGYTFSADTETEEITISEAGVAPVRGQQVFNTSIQPVNWSFSSYLRPRYEGGAVKGDSVDRVLWEALAARPWLAADGGTVNIDTNTDGLAAKRTATTMTADFAYSNTNQLRTVTIVLFMGATAWMITDVAVNQLELDFSIESIATATWSGFGNSIKEITGASLTAVQGWVGTPLTTVRTGVNDFLAAPADNACIRNKLTTVYLENNETLTEYTIAITGGSLTINNNIEYLVPEALGAVNLPCAHFTGARQISGELTAYLKSGSVETAGLLADMLDDLTTVTQNFHTIINVGGSSTDRPVIEFNLPHANISIPAINTESVIGVSIAFSGLPYDEVGSVFDLEETNELTVSYKPAI